MRLLDLFCGAGGAAVGYSRAGFTEIVGVDISPQPNYPFDFIQADALNPPVRLEDFDLVHASPPCQAFTSLNQMWNARPHDDLLTPTISMLDGLPHVIENVERAPMPESVVLCGSSFGLGVGDAGLRRHRQFQTSHAMLVPPCHHARTKRVIGVYGGHGRDRRRVTNTEDFSVADRRIAMGIDWMTGAELSEAIPPAYTQFIGEQFINQAAFIDQQALDFV